jgi:Trypsin-co-occurring domain 2
MPQEFSLADFVAQVRAEMLVAIEEGEGTSLRFLVDQVELEVQVAVTEKTDQGGGIDLKVIKWGASDEQTLGRTYPFRGQKRPSRGRERGLRRVKCGRGLGQQLGRGPV